jgi:hypothetical protein
MDNSLLMGVWRIMISLPPDLWHKQMAKETQSDLSFISPDHTSECAILWCVRCHGSTSR